MTLDSKRQQNCRELVENPQVVRLQAEMEPFFMLYGESIVNDTMFKNKRNLGKKKKKRGSFFIMMSL